MNFLREIKRNCSQNNREQFLHQNWWSIWYWYWLN